MNKYHIISFKYSFIHLKPRNKHNSAVVLAQGRRSRLSEMAISLRQITLAWARLETVGN